MSMWQRWFKNIFLFQFAFAFILSSFAKEPVEWEKIIEKENIVLFKKKSSIDTIKDFKAEFIFNTTLTNAEEYIKNPDRYKEWISNLERVSLVKKGGDSGDTYRFLLYIIPALKREGAVKITKNSGVGFLRYTIALDTANHCHFQYKTVRYFSVEWELVELASHKVKMRMHYLGYSEKYNFFIAGIIDKLTINALFHLIENLKDCLESS